jgi:6-phosphogluconolactonase
VFPFDKYRLCLFQELSRLPAAMKFLSSLMTLSALSIGALSARAADESFYIGTYTKPGGSEGVYHYSLNTANGAVSGGELVATLQNPTFLAIRPDGKYLYAVNEIEHGSVSAFGIEADGKLKPLNHQTSGGPGPAHVWVDHSGKNVLAANYGGGSVEVIPIKDDGSLAEPTSFIPHTGSSVDPNRQKEPHAHSIYTDATNHFVYVCDLGLDKVLVYKFDAAKGTITPNDPPFATVPPGSGPRHLAFHPKGFAYVINEMLSTVTSFTHDAEHGTMKAIETISTLPPGIDGKGNSTAEIFIHPNGKFLYGSNRGHNSIAVFSIDTTSGKLTPIDDTSTEGKVPRSFAIDPSGNYLLAANQDTNNVTVFHIDTNTGKLSPAGQSFNCGAPVCVMFVANK